MSRRWWSRLTSGWTAPDPAPERAYPYPDPADEAERIVRNAERGLSVDMATMTVVAEVEPSLDLMQRRFEDGVAYAEGHVCLDEALRRATEYLADPVHGARRAMLVLAGHVRVPAEVVAR